MMRLKALVASIPFMYCVKEDACIVSYAPRYAGFFEELQEAGVIDILTEIHARFAIKKMQLMKFKHERVKEYGNARVLKKADYPLYEEFFRSTSPTADPTGWLQEYFEEKCKKNISRDILRMTNWCLFATRRICHIWKIQFSIPGLSH